MIAKRLMRTAIWRASRVFARSFGGVSDALFKLASVYVKAYKNLNYDMESNGEFTMLARLARTDPRTVFDVGANVGDYSAACSERMANATIHAFEIAPPTFRRLVENVGAEKRIKLNNVGLSDANGELELFYNAANEGSSSSVRYVSEIYPEALEIMSCQVITGDHYCELNRIEAIDLLKIDVEGAEHRVLHGFKRMLEKGAISCIQFEFGLLNIYTKFLLTDFWRLFAAYGFEVGPIMPDGVEFMKYDPREEDFQGCPNYLAVHRSRPDLIQSVSNAKGGHHVAAFDPLQDIAPSGRRTAWDLKPQ